MDRLTLYIGNRNYSSWSLRGWLPLKHAGLTFDETVIPLDFGDTRETILKHSPSGRVPALKHGEIQIWDSLAICEYVNEIAPAAKLWPEDAHARAVARSVSAEMHSGFSALRQAMPMNLRRKAKPVAIEADTQADITRITALWEDCRARFGGGAGQGPFLFGQFTIADVMYAPVVSRFRSYAVDPGPVGTAYMDAVWATPAMQKWTSLASGESWEIRKYDALPSPK